MATQFRILAEKAKDPVIADGYRRLAKGYESLASHPDPPPQPEHTDGRPDPPTCR